MKKYLLIAFIGLSHALTHTNGREKLENSRKRMDESFQKLVHHTKIVERENNYRKEQQLLGMVTALSIPATFLGWSLSKKLIGYQTNKAWDYRGEKALRNDQYKQNPSFKAYCKKTGWVLRNQIQNLTRFTTCNTLAVWTLMIPSLTSLIAPGLMYINYKDNRYLRNRDINDKRA